MSVSLRLRALFSAVLFTLIGVGGLSVAKAQGAGQPGGQIACTAVFPTVLDSSGRPDSATIKLNRRTLDHVIEGAFSQIRGSDGRKVWVLQSGAHFARAIDEFRQERTDVDRFLRDNPAFEIRHSNGVVTLFLPANAFSNRPNEYMVDSRRQSVLVGKKSIFPRHWTEAKLIEAIHLVIKKGRVAERTSEGRVVMIGDVFEVRMRVVVGADGQMISAYPTPDQPNAGDVRRAQ